MARSALSFFSRSLLLGASLAAAACGVAADDSDSSDGAITSNDGVALEFEFTGEVVARSSDSARRAIATQLQYVQGILVTDADANGQTGMPGLANIRETEEGDKKRITYEAKLPVVWPKNRALPDSYELALPLDVTALSAFNAKYDGSCGRNEYGQSSFWHDFNPKAPGCVLDDADVHRAPVAVRPHPQATQDVYPEYDKIWEDDALDVVAVFGIISSNTPQDEGARTREKLLREVAASLEGAERSEAPEARGILADSTVTGTANVDGRERRVTVRGILVNEVASAGTTFEQRYAEATAKADVVIYEGHSGLGKNISALARNMGAERNKYQLVYLYGCQTLGYLEPVMHEKRTELNGADADPEGTKYLDVIANALPAYGDDGRSTLALYRAMLDMRSPKTFNALIRGISPWHLVVVFGEHDNTFRP